ncbi:MAG: T9SS type A sorting domain-containing protein [Bacteroidetes bacterium]|jgi:hypothetical protein|nr:T9SS type A sorting domain-containing protein [Bacteroidota bacterium]
MKTVVKIICILTALSLADGLGIKSFAQSWQWAARIGSAAGTTDIPDEMVNDIKTDAQGNVYLCGRLCKNADFNGLPLNNLFPSTGYCSFLAKTDCAGNLLWIKIMGGLYGYNMANALALDNNGNIYLTGQLGAITPMPCTFMDSVITEEAVDLFLAKFDTAGNFKWVNWAAKGPDYLFTQGSKIEMDSQNQIYVMGLGITTGGGVLFPGYTVPPTWAYVARFDTSGNINKLMNIGNNIQGPFVKDYKLNPVTGDQYITGSFSNDSVVIGDTTLFRLAISSGSDLFLAKFDSAGLFQWVRQIGDTILNFSKGYGISIDSSDIVVVGGTAPTTTIDGFGFSNPLSTNFNMDVPFVAKFNSNGTCLWTANSFHKYQSRATGGITTSGNGDSYFAGWYAGQAIFGSTTFSGANGVRDIFLAKISPSGVILSADSISGTGTEEVPKCITSDVNNNVYIGGSFDGTMTVNGVNYTQAGGNSDGFIAKWGYSTGCTVGLNENNLAPDEHLFLFPNPVNKELNIQPSNFKIQKLEVYDLIGNKITETNANNREGVIKLNVSSFASGLYIIRAFDENRSVVKKFVKE